MARGIFGGRQGPWSRWVVASVAVGGSLAVIAPIAASVSGPAAAASVNGCVPTALTPRFGAAVAPAPRGAGYEAGDGQGASLVAFGGEGTSGPLADTWGYENGGWVLLDPAQSPPARFGASLVYDPVAGEDVLFGGTGPRGLPLADTWVWDGSSWHQVHPEQSPPARSGAAAAYGPIPHGGSSAGVSGGHVGGFPGDQGQGVVLFGGEGASGPLGDTWVWDGQSWHQVHPAQSPPARSGAAAAYGPIPHGGWSDAGVPGGHVGGFPGDQGQGVVLFGGEGASGPLADTWVWDGQSWRQLHPATSPPSRSAAGLVYDFASHTYVLVGGMTLSSKQQLEPLDDTWGFDDSTWTEVATGASEPSAPTGVTAVAGNGEATVTWTAPAADGGAPVTQYQVKAIPSGKTAVVHGCPTATSATVTGLADGHSYLFTVTATNATGTSQRAVTESVVTPLGPPDPPTHVVATADDGSAAVSWQAPAVDNGSPVTSYTVAPSPPCPGCRGLTVSGGPPATLTTVSGLTDGTSYTFAVKAANALGTGAASVASTTVTPTAAVGAPGAVRDLVVTAEAGQAQVFFDPPASGGGSKIVAYDVRATPVSQSPSPAARPALRAAAAQQTAGSPPCLLTWRQTCIFRVPAPSQGADPSGAWQLQYTDTTTGGQTVIYGTACSDAEDCVAVGVAADASGQDPAPYVASTHDGGTTWSTGSFPAASGGLTSVSCTSVQDCVAVGPLYGNGSFTDGAWYSTDGGASWQAASGPWQSTAAVVDAVSCAAGTTTCDAASAGGAADASVLYTSTDSGRSWGAVPESPATSQTFAAGIHGLSCATAATCVAVGIAAVPGGPGGITTYEPAALVTDDGGTTWHEQPLGPATNSPARFAEPMAVSCPTTSDCEAVGIEQSAPGSYASVAWATTDGGATWSSQDPTPDVASSANPVTFDVSCPAPGTCVAAGYTNTVETISGSTYLVPSGPVLEKTVDGGANWFAQSISLPPSTTLALVGVACASTSACEAGGGTVSLSSTAPPGFVHAAVIGIAGACPLVSSGQQSSTSCATVTTSGANAKVIVSGLANGTAYVVSVTAANSAGDVGPATTSAPAMVGEPPPPPTVNIVGQLQAVTVTWAQPPSPAAVGAVTGYFVMLSTPAGTVQDVSLPATTRLRTFNSLQSGTTYFATVSAVNAAGSNPTQSTSVTLQNRTQASGTVVAVVAAHSGAGYYLVTSAGDVYTFGDAQSEGDLTWPTPVTPAAPIVAMALTPDGQGYWLVDADGDIYTLGDATYHGAIGQLDPTQPPGGTNAAHLSAPIVGIAPTPDGGGYWLAAADGGVFSFGDATYHGSMGGRQLDAAVVAMAATPDGGGYWLAAKDGGVFAFGDASFDGSMGGITLVAPITAMAATSNGTGYWLAAADGGVFAFAPAGFYGSEGGQLTTLGHSAVGIAPTSDNYGYWLAGQDGGVFAFGDAGYHGNAELAPEQGTLWGVDTTSNMANIWSSVVSKAGTPQFVGRYIQLGTATPLQSGEAHFIHDNGVPILMIASPNTNSLTGGNAEQTGWNEALQSIRAANALGATSGAIFRDVEEGEPISASYIRGWTSAFEGTGYTPGFYENSYSPSDPFPSAYCQVSTTLTTHIYLYASEGEPYDNQPVGQDTRANAPTTWGVAVPPCANQTVAWQYAERQYIPASQSAYPNIDLDEYQALDSNLLWSP